MGGPRQPDPGTQPGCYRCSLPGLTGFTAGCRGGTDADHRYFTSLGSSGAIQRISRLKRPRVLGYAAAPCPFRVRVLDSGEVAEWLKAHAWKVCIRPKGVSRVRIPPSPPVLRHPAVDPIDGERDARCKRDQRAHSVLDTPDSIAAKRAAAAAA